MLPQASFSVTAIASMALLAAVGLRALMTLPRIWRAELLYPEMAPPWWLWGQPLWCGFTRCMAVAIVFCVPGAVIAFLAALGDVVFGASEIAVRAMSGVALGLFAVGVLFAISVVMFVRPKAFVPPSRRNELGVISSWKVDFKRRRAERGDRSE